MYYYKNNNMNLLYNIFRKHTYNANFEFKLFIILLTIIPILIGYYLFGRLSK
jgi:hypothetical protein